MKYFTALLLICALACTTFSGCKLAGVSIINYKQIRAMIDKETLEEDVTQRTWNMVDIRSADLWSKGHIQDAKNVPFDEFIDGDENLIDGGVALTAIVPDTAKTLIVYGSGDGSAIIFAKQAKALGYRVKCYQGGTADWEAHGEYYIMEYAAFRQWYDENCPFDDGKNYLVDVLGEAVYNGSLPGELSGHIAGAINIPLFSFADLEGNAVDDGAAFKDVIADTEATIVTYCFYDHCPMGYYAVKAMVPQGYKHLYRYMGGLQGWIDEGNTLYKGEDKGPCAP